MKEISQSLKIGPAVKPTITRIVLKLLGTIAVFIFFVWFTFVAFPGVIWTGRAGRIYIIVFITFVLMVFAVYDLISDLTGMRIEITPRQKK